MLSEDIKSIDSEAGIIASLIQKPDLSYYSENLLPMHFYDKYNRYVYQAIVDLTNKGITRFDPYNILEDLSSSPATRKASEEISVAQLQEMIDMSDLLARSTIDEYKMLVHNVLDASFRRDAAKLLKSCQTKCADMEVEDIKRFIYEEIDDLISSYSTIEEIPMFSDVVDDLWGEVLLHQDGNDYGAPFKFPTLNDFVRIEPGELVVVAAPPKGAKSMFCLNEAVDLLKRGKSVMYIDSELSSRMFLCRMISHLTGIEFHRIRSGRYSEEEDLLIQDAKRWIKSVDFVHIYMPIFDKETIYTSVKKIHHRFGGLDVLIVDYLKPTGNTDAYAVYAELGALTDMVKNDLCGDLGIAGLAAAQLNENGRLADSAKISRDASTIMLLKDKTIEEIEDQGRACGNKKLIVQFNRNGMQHIDGEWIDLEFNGNIVSLEEAKQHIPEIPY